MPALWEHEDRFISRVRNTIYERNKRRRLVRNYLICLAVVVAVLFALNTVLLRVFYG
jgi:hypothetical protein